MTRSLSGEHDAASSLPHGSGDRKICVARIGAAHGVRGEVRLWTFTDDPLAVTQYGPLSTKDGARSFVLSTVREAKGHLVAALKGVDNRETAETLNGLELYVAREKLPPPNDDEFYHADLIGLRAVDPAGTEIGHVAAVHNFGASDLIELAGGTSHGALLPFSRAVVPVIDFANGFVVIDRPAEIDGDSPSSAD